MFSRRDDCLSPGDVSRRFKLNFAPHLGIVPGGAGLFAASAGADVVGQIQFCDDNGFQAIEDNFLLDRPVSVQEHIGRTLAARRMTMGCFLAVRALDRPTFGLDRAEVLPYLRSELTCAVATAHRVGGKYLTVIPGRVNPARGRAEQLRNLIENLKELAPVAEAAGVTLLLEAVSRKRWRDILIPAVRDAHAICQAVGSPSVRLLFDVYQCQCESGDLIENLDFCWDEVECIQIADNPGRLEPGTGEINFGNVLAHLARRGWTGLVEMEHGLARPGAQGERNVIGIYQALSDGLAADLPARRNA